MGMLRKAGTPVKLSFVSATPATANLIVIYNADDVALTLQPWQRLVVDSLQFNTDAAADASNLAYVCDAATAPSAVPAITIATFSCAPNIGAQGTVFPGEGRPCHLAYNLYLLLVGDSWSTANTAISGVGRIVEITQGPQAGYKALLTPSGNINGQ